MEMQWFAFFKRAQSERNKAIVVIGATLLLGISPSVAYSTTEGNSIKSAESKVEDGFLKLPAFDLERVSSNTQEPVKVGDPLKLNILNFNLQENSKSEKSWSIEAAGSVDLQSEGWTIQQNEKKSASESGLSLTATPLKEGQLALPSLVIKNSDGQAVARTNPLQVEVVSAISSQDTKPQQPEDIEPPVGLQFPWKTVLLWGIALLLVLCLAGYAFYRWQKYKKPKVFTPVPEVKRSEDETALLHLDELEKLDYLSRHEYKKYYFRLSEILKAYIGGRYRFDALESTTHEIIAELENKKKINDTWLDRIEKVFDKLDRVKFTDHIPIGEEGRELIREAREFVMTTRRLPSVGANSTGEVGHAIR